MIEPRAQRLFTSQWPECDLLAMEIGTRLNKKPRIHGEVYLGGGIGSRSRILMPRFLPLVP